MGEDCTLTWGVYKESGVSYLMDSTLGEVVRFNDFHYRWVITKPNTGTHPLPEELRGYAAETKKWLEGEWRQFRRAQYILSRESV